MALIVLAAVLGAADASAATYGKRLLAGALGVLSQYEQPRVTSNLAILGDQLYFGGNQGNRYGIYRTDGTIAGTHLIHAVRSTTIDEVVAHRGNVYYQTTVGRGWVLNKTDGTAKGTKQLHRFSDGGVDQLTSAGPYVYFLVRTDEQQPQLWRTDGTSAGTILLLDLGKTGGAYLPFPGSPRVEWIAYDDKLWFSAAPDAAEEYELWSSDGTPGGTGMAADVCPDPDCGSVPYHFGVFDGGLYFSAAFVRRYDEVFGAITDRELWMYKDGVAREVTNIATDEPLGSDPALLSVLNGRLFLAASIGHKDGPVIDSGGRDVWVVPPRPGEKDQYDGEGNDRGAARVKNLHPDDQAPNDLSDMVAADHRLFFNANGDLWTSDGTEDGTRIVAPFDSFGLSSDQLSAYDLFAVGNDAYFVTGPEDDKVLWRSDGTAAGTMKVPNFDPGVHTLGAEDFTVFKGTLFFIADPGVLVRITPDRLPAACKGLRKAAIKVLDAQAHAVTNRAKLRKRTQTRAVKRQIKSLSASIKRLGTTIAKRRAALLPAGC